jgi:hypothetical protein
MIETLRSHRLAMRTAVWICLVLATVLAWCLGGFYVRELVAALILFTVVFAAVAVLLALFVLLEEALDRCATRCRVSANRVPAMILARLRAHHP